jgi:hypothetical protein
VGADDQPGAVEEGRQGDVPDAFARAVRMARPWHHEERAGHIGNGGDPASLRDRQAKGLDDLRRPKAEAIDASDEAEFITGAELPVDGGRTV